MLPPFLGLSSFKKWKTFFWSEESELDIFMYAIFLFSNIEKKRHNELD